MEKITILSSFDSPRLRYTCDLIFKSFLGVDYVISDQLDKNIDQVAIDYSSTASANESAFSIPGIGLLNQFGIREIEAHPGSMNGLPYLFECDTSEGMDLPFDLFSMVFFLITRYEEYYDRPKDQYGRYQSKYSSASIYEFMHLPIIDLWVQKLATLLNEKFRSSLSISGEFKVHPTIDIDLPYAYRKKYLRFAAGFCKDLFRLHIPGIKSRLRYLNKGKDPFDTYKYLEDKLSDPQAEPATIFFLNNYHLPIDGNHLANTQEFANIIRDCKRWAHVGVHPSQSSRPSIEQLFGEKEFISRSVNKPILASRQHYLLLDQPDTYRSLIQIGIKEDFSMSYPDVLGFRAGTSHSFLWYDLVHEVETKLIVHSNAVMDVTLRYYLAYSPEQAIEECRKLMEQTKKVNGTFRFIWHNSNLSDAYGWKPWIKVFDFLISARAIES